MSATDPATPDAGDCPKCGCNDAVVLPGVTRWGVPAARRRCNHCGFSWVAAAAWPAAKPKPDQPPDVRTSALRGRVPPPLTERHR